MFRQASHTAPVLVLAVLAAAALLLAACGGPVGTGKADDVPLLGLFIDDDNDDRAIPVAPPPHADPRPHAPLDLSRLVVVGDSLGATQNSCIYEGHTTQLYPSLIARQAGVPMPVPLVEWPGLPPCLILTAEGVVPSGSFEQRGARTNPGTLVHNLSVPGTRVQGAIDPERDIAHYESALFDPIYPYRAFDATVLDQSAPADWQHPPESMVTWAIRLKPTALIVWLGANDVLWSAIRASPRYITGYENGEFDPGVFEHHYTMLLAILDQFTHARIVVANIPDVTVIPYLTPAEVVLAGVAADPTVPLTVEQLFFLLGLQPGDYLTPLAGEAIPEALAAALATSPPTPQTLPDDVVFTAAEVAISQKAVDAFNGIIAAEAARHGVPVVDMHGLLNEVDANGYELWPGGPVITTDYLGGVFSLDGIHPTNIGHAVIANTVIDVLNTEFDAGLDPVDLMTVQPDWWLPPGSTGSATSATQAMSPQAARQATGALE